MTNEEKAREIIGGGCNQQGCSECGGSLSIAEGCVEFRHLKAMAKWKDSQQQIIEIFGKRVKIVKDDYSSAESCKACALLEPCYSSKYTLCQTVDEKFNRHFVEVDEEGNEIK